MLNVRKDSFLPIMSLRYLRHIFSSNIMAEGQNFARAACLSREKLVSLHRHVKPP